MAATRCRAGPLDLATVGLYDMKVRTEEGQTVGRATTGTQTMLVRRSIALADLASLLAYLPDGAVNGAVRTAVVDDNVLAKATVQARENALRQLVHYYGITAGDPAFAILRQLWRDYPVERPICALLLACSRDRVLAATTALIAGMPIDTAVDYEALAGAAADWLAHLLPPAGPG